MPPATPPIAPSHLTCLRCGYNLTGLTIGGTCPECGAPIEETLRGLHQGLTSNIAVACMVVGILSLTFCPLLGIVAIVLYVMAQSQLATGIYAQSSRGMATAGLILGMIGTLITLAYGGFLFFIFLAGTL